MTAIRRSAGTIFLLALLAARSASSSEIAIPSLVIDGTGNFYVTLRSAAADDSMRGVPASMRAAAARLRDLTEFLPDSLPLRTEAKTVLIIHRKNPRYRAHVERLLWRRLDPALSAPGSPAEIPLILSRAASDLKPVCHEGADSIRWILADLYRSSYPVYQASLWPSDRRSLTNWKADFDREIRPLERRLLGRLSRDLALPMPDSSKVGIRLVTKSLPEGNGVFSPTAGSYLLLAECDEPARGRGGIQLLRSYLRIADALAPEGAITAPRRLAGALDAIPGDRAAGAQIPDLFLDYAIARALESTLGWPIPPFGPEHESAIAVIKKHWDAYLAGGITLETACDAIAAEAARPLSP